MPVYDYHCRSCGTDFVQKEKIAEHGQASAVCPKCKSQAVDRVLSAPFARTARKS